MAFPAWNRKIHKTGRDEREMGSKKRTYRSRWLSEVKRSMIDGPRNDPQLTAHMEVHPHSKKVNASHYSGVGVLFCSFLISYIKSFKVRLGRKLKDHVSSLMEKPQGRQAGITEVSGR